MPKKREPVIYNGLAKSLAEWCKTLKIPYGTAFHRYKAGWDIEEVLSTYKLRNRSKIYLSPREFYVAMLVAKGFSDRRIASYLGLKIRTEGKIVTSILEKSGSTKRIQIMLNFIENKYSTLIGGKTFKFKTKAYPIVLKGYLNEILG